MRTSDSNSEKNDGNQLSKFHTFSLTTLLVLAYMAFGILMGLVPQIYPEEAKRRGAVSAEVRLDMLL